MADRRLNMDIADALIERPTGFSVGRRHFRILPVTLGKAQLVSRLVESILPDRKTLGTNPYKAALDASLTKRNDCIRLVAYSTMEGDTCLDERAVQKRMGQLRKIRGGDLAALVVAVLTQDRTDEIIRHFSMNAEQERMKKALKAKKDGGSLSFGGKSVWGTLVDFACERYGWTLHYVLWGISYCNLQLLMADHIKTVYLTEEERKKARISTDGIVIKADDAQAFRDFVKSQSWR